MSTRDRPTTLTTASVLFGSLSSGTHASTIDTAVTKKPTEASAIATGLPPGTRITSGPAGSRCSAIIAANMNRNGMKFVMMPMLTSASYAPRTDVFAWLRNTNRPAKAACTRRETYGVLHVGCSRPNPSDPGAERQPCGGREPPASGAERGHGQQHRAERRQPGEADARQHCLNRLHRALQSGYLPFRNRDEDGQRCHDIQKSDDDAGGENGSRHRAPGVANLLAHRRSAFDAAERKRDRGPEDGILEARARRHRFERQRCRGAEAEP